ncbi:MAG TPA: shikimate dehydrogenase [Dehalococcoidia bacterium]|nr:shikimate dehydrogenase [Dehalococcoidia bacterium]
MVSGRTRLCGLIGDPVEHTMSPAMHNAAYQQMGLDYVYVPFRVRPEELGKAIDGMRAFNIRGLNVTIPHKVAVIPFLDKLDPLAEKIGAVNTIVNDNGVLTGYNTDATGFLHALFEKGVEPRGKKALILGAGGASRAVSLILADSGAERLIILNRSEELDWAYELAGNISQLYNMDAKAGELNRESLDSVMERIDISILVNATSVGMTPNIEDSPVDAYLLRPELVVFDVVYNPLRTRLLRDAEAAGAETISGIEMLAWQGALAFEKWTGREAPLDLMRKEAIGQLEEHED